MSKIQNTPPNLRETAEEAQFFEEMKKRLNVAAVTDPAGGGTVDTECRAALVALMDNMRAAGLLDS